MYSHVAKLALLSLTAGVALTITGCGKHAPAPPTVTAAASASAIKPPVPMIGTAAAARTTAPMPAPSPAVLPLAGTGAVNPIAGTTPAPIASTAFAIATLTLGDAVNPANEITRPGSSFTANDKILYASVATTGNSLGVTLNAKWSYLEGQGQLFSSVNQAIATHGPAVTTFKVQNPDLWPEGKYKVEISLDGKPVASQNFEIRKD